MAAPPYPLEMPARNAPPPQPLYPNQFPAIINDDIDDEPPDEGIPLHPNIAPMPPPSSHPLQHPMQPNAGHVLSPPQASGLAEHFDPAQIRVILANQRADPNSPLYSVTRFEDLGLPPELLRGLYSLGFTKPSRIQERALPLLLADPPTNLVAQSQSGTGKTAAFVLTMLKRVDCTAQNQPPQALCLVNTRELATQVYDAVTQMGVQTDVKVAMFIRDMPRTKEQSHAHIIIGTPGTVLEAARRKFLNLSKIKIMVLDEADELLEAQSLGDQVRTIRRMVPQNAQFLLFSATFETTKVKEFALAFAPNPNLIILELNQVKSNTIKQFYIVVRSRDEKMKKLADIYGLLTVGSSIVFCRTRYTAKEVAAFMQSEGHEVQVITGEDDAGHRDKTIEAFRAGAFRCLVTTNLLARGFDCPAVNLVVNYDLPFHHGKPDFESYIHRIGRTGRFGRFGCSINLLDSNASMSMQQQILEHYQMDCQEMPDDYEQMEKLLRECRAS